MSGKIVSIGFIGPFSPPFVGDGIKNDFLKEGFANAGVRHIHFFDSINRESSKLKYYRNLLAFIWRHPLLILSLNKNGRIFMVAVLFFVRLAKRKKVALFVIGGSFDRQIAGLQWIFKKLYVHELNKMDVVMAESLILKNGLGAVGLRNVEIVYNPRKDDGVRWSIDKADRMRIVFVSRVTETKGVANLIRAVELVNETGHTLVGLDVYGDIDPGYEAEFIAKCENSNGTIRYKGVLQPDQVQRTITGYRLLALPTYHFGEGLPGILVESGMVGIPVLITRYNSLGEYFEHDVSACFVECHDVEGIKEQLVWMLSDDALCVRLGNGIKKVAEPFKLGVVMELSLSLMAQRGWKFEI
ncbi:MAG: glycosyltransferase family 4 protein [Breznakibacter sp.]